MTPSFQLHTDRPRELLLVRHGQTEWNVIRRIQSWRPVPLNKIGERQVHETALLLDGLLARSSNPSVAVWSSPILRAEQSAEIICEVLRVAGSPRFHDGLKEFDMGDWTGHLVSSLQKKKTWQSFIKRPGSTTFPNGESMPEIQQRGVEAVREILATETANTVVITSHGGLVRLVVMALLGLSLDEYHRLSIDNASVTRVRFSPDAGPRFLCLNRSPRPRPFL